MKLGFPPFCSSSCVREHDRLSREASRMMEALREQVRTARRRRSLRLLSRLRAELDEDAAAVVALSEAGATVRQIARYRALDPKAVQKLLFGEDEARAARRDARDRARRRRDGKTRARARRAGHPEPAWQPPADWADALGDSLESVTMFVRPDPDGDAAA